MVKWDAIKIDYITNSDMSLRAVAKKHGVNFSLVSRRSAAEGWAEEKKQYQVKSVSISLDKIMARQAARRERVERIADRLLDQLERAANELDLVEVVSKTKEKEVTSGGMEIERSYEDVGHKSTGMVNRQGAKMIAAALKDVKEVQMLQSALEERKQKVQLEILEQQRDQQDADGTVTAVFKGETDALSE